MKLITQLTALILFLALFIASCEFDGLGFDSKPDNDEPFYSIKDVVVSPDTVAPGDTATFTAIPDGDVELIEKYRWTGISGNPRTDSNIYHWVADTVLGTRKFMVSVVEHEKYGGSNAMGFQIVVEE
ncbi:MAG: hypothetical protein WD267_07760 [Balneolales bacterium]